jgi:PadR family transcriptional regulator, regulatory protein PadR
VHHFSPAAAMDELDVNLLRGTLDLLILKSLSWGPRHGYAVAEWIGQATGTMLRVGEGTLYPALHRLERQGLVEAEWGLSENNRTAKFYRLSRTGRRRFSIASTSWHDFVEAASRALRTGTSNPI